MERGLIVFSAHLLLLNTQSHNRGSSHAAGRAEIRRKNIRGALSSEALAAIGACAVLVVVVGLTMRDRKPRFHFDSAAATPAPSSPAAPAGSAPATAGPTPDVQALFVQGRAESPLIGSADGPLLPPFVTNTDYARPPVFREIREAELGKIYASASKKDRRALGKVARLGGVGSPDAMAQTFGYPSVDQMLWNWDRTIASTPQFQAENFGTNSSPPLPFQD